MGFDGIQTEIKDDVGGPLPAVITDPTTPSQQAVVDATGALKVTGGSIGEQYQDADVVQAGDKGTVAIGSDGTNYRFLKVDSNGQLQVDVLTLPAVDISDRSARDLGLVRLTEDGVTPVDVTNVGALNRLAVESFPSGAAGAEQNVIITDPTTPAYQALVDSSGRLQVSTQPPTPNTSTPISGTADGTHAGSVTTYFTLSVTLTSTIQKFIAGGEGKKATKVELYEDASGTGSPLVLLAKGFIPEGGGNVNFDLNGEFVANGTRRLAVVRTNLGGGSTETFAAWSGFEV